MMVPKRTDKEENASTQPSPSPSPIPSTSPMPTDTHASPMQSPMPSPLPSPSKKRPRRSGNASRNSKRRRLSQSGLSPDMANTRSRSKESIPTKLDDMESWCALLSYIDDFVSSKLIPEQQGRNLRKLVRYKDPELKHLYNSFDKSKNEKDLLSLFNLAQERCPKLSSPFVPSTPTGFSNDIATFHSPQPQSTPPTTMMTTPSPTTTKTTKTTPMKQRYYPSDQTPPHVMDQNMAASNSGSTQVPSMQDILQQLTHLDTGFADSPIHDMSPPLEQKQALHENSPSAKLIQNEIQQQLQYQRQQKQNQQPNQDGTFSENSTIYNELSESELYYLLMSELNKPSRSQYLYKPGSSSSPSYNADFEPGLYYDTETKPLSHTHKEQLQQKQEEPEPDQSTSSNYQNFENLFGFDYVGPSAPTPYQTPTPSSQGLNNNNSNNNNTHEEDLSYITHSLLNVDFDTQSPYLDFEPSNTETSALPIASPSDLDSISIDDYPNNNNNNNGSYANRQNNNTTNNNNNDPPLSLLFPFDLDQDRSNIDLNGDQSDFPLPDLPQFEDYGDYRYNSPDTC